MQSQSNNSQSSSFNKLSNSYDSLRTYNGEQISKEIASLPGIGQPFLVNQLRIQQKSKF